MYGRQPRLPFEVEKFVKYVDEEQGEIEKLATELSSEDSLQEHIEKMSATRDALFPNVQANIAVAQKKQQQEYLKRRGGFQCSFKNGDVVLRRNMLQKTKVGHKMENQWIGPYTIENLDSQKGTCKLRRNNGNRLRTKVNVKNVKLYAVPAAAQKSGAVQQSAAPQQPGHNVLSITEEDIAATFNDKILSELTEIVNGTKRSWQHNIFSGCIYTANRTGVNKSELK